MKRFCLLCLSLSLALSAPLWACGPFIFDNTELDSLSLLDPGVTGRPDLAPFYLYASPAYGLTGNFQQKVIRLSRVSTPSAEDVSNEVFDDDPGADPDWLKANAEAWAGYLRTTNGKPWTAIEIQKALDGQGVPREAKPVDAEYFRFLTSTPVSESKMDTGALQRARNPSLPEFIRERYAYLALRGYAIAQNSSETLRLWHEFSPLWAHDVIAGRALAWVASFDTGERLRDYLTVFQEYPALRATVFVSLGGFSSQSWSQYLARNLTLSQRRWALYARFVLEDRDFSPETLQGILAADPQGRLALAAFYRMVEEVEQEAGLSRLFALTFDPAAPVPPGTTSKELSFLDSLRRKGLYTALVDTAVQAASGPHRNFRRAWLTLAAYLAFYDGDETRMVSLYHASLAYPARNDAQSHQSHLLGTMVAMVSERHKSWSNSLQRRLIIDLAWAKSLDKPGHNRGLYHSLVVLVAQKDLWEDHRDAAARAFSTLQTQTWDNPYRLHQQDWFWSASWGANDPVNILFDVLLRKQDLSAWQKFLKTPALRSPLDQALTAPGWVTEADLEYLEAYKDLRQGLPDLAIPLAEKLTKEGYFQGSKSWRNDHSVFPTRQFATSTSVDWAHPWTGQGLKALSFLALAQQMKALQTAPLLEQANFWLSLQLSGFPLIFSTPPIPIRFVNDLTYYGYDGSDPSPETAFPLNEPRRAAEFQEEFQKFQEGEFSPLNRALRLYQTAADSPDPETQAGGLAMSAWLGKRELYRKLKQRSLQGTTVYRTLFSHCETLRSFL